MITGLAPRLLLLPSPAGRAGDQCKAMAGCEPAWGSPGGIAGGADRRRPVALARWVACSCPHASLLHTRQSVLSTDTISFQ